ncbi:pterin-4-alpha-carbinolamine dehydratase [Oleiphilus messinensis]|uniref:Putative pterin-4-alpha-carbinolamine dehydratase n=1 Tax=Oleiphilus messinensis TaxID=141451 RepID=A0A1Y0IDP4_9GAMM|nr:4a-hydroxytetrahydrobiopterin dehydratase [Oleiphilus messinensis]ARU57513.1 pterin-4-alpha-carbinolamine dehydratase [Oleiphilus messinensis]
MATLAEQECEVCRVGAPTVPEEEWPVLLAELPEWSIEKGVENCLSRVFVFKNFAQALQFTNQVGAVAESEGHHPLLITEWGRVTVKWWTHKIGGLHKTDFIMAARTDKLV